MEKLLASTFNSLAFRRSDSVQQATPSVPLTATTHRGGPELYKSSMSSWPNQQRQHNDMAVQQRQQHNVVFNVKSLGSGNSAITRGIKAQLSFQTPAPLLLHSLPRHPLIPSTCPFALKLECYLRLTNTDYTLTCDRPLHPQTKKSPWLEVGEEEYFDTNLIIERCERELSMRASHSRRRLDYDLSGERKTVNRALLAMLEERTWWAWQLVHEVYGNDNYDASASNGGFPSSIKNEKAALQRQLTVNPKTWYASVEQQGDAAAKLGRWPKLVKTSLDSMWKRRSVTRDAYAHGIGRLPQAAVVDIGLNDLTALSDLLHENDTLFLLGDSPHTVDCFAFGLLAQMLYIGHGGVFHNHITYKLPTLVRYVENMRLTIWPDWHELCAAAAARRTTVLPAAAAATENINNSSSAFDLTYGPTLRRMRRMRQYKPQTRLLSWRSQECHDDIECRVANKLVARAMAEAQAEYEDELKLLARYPHSPW